MPTEFNEKKDSIFSWVIEQLDICTEKIIEPWSLPIITKHRNYVRYIYNLYIIN